MSKMKRCVFVAEREVAKLQKKETLTQERGETVDGELQDDFLSIVHDNSKEMKSTKAQTLSAYRTASPAPLRLYTNTQVRKLATPLALAHAFAHVLIS